MKTLHASMAMASKQAEKTDTSAADTKQDRGITRMGMRLSCMGRLPENWLSRKLSSSKFNGCGFCHMNALVSLPRYLLAK